MKEKRHYRIDYTLESIIYENQEVTKVLTYLKNGNIKHSQKYYYNQKLHHINKPAIVDYDKDNNIIRELWYKSGQLHHTNGPAIIRYFFDGSIQNEKFYIEGQEYNELEYWTEMERLNETKS